MGAHPLLKERKEVMLVKAWTSEALCQYRTMHTCLHITEAKNSTSQKTEPAELT